MKLQKLIPALAAALLLAASCGTPKLAYLADLEPGTTSAIENPQEIRLRSGDMISIIVNSRDPQLTDLFNLPIVSRQIGSNSTGYRTPQGISGYTIDEFGDIDFPVLGRLHISGMTRNEVEEYVKEQLLERNLVKDPVATVDFMNLTVSVLGEVSSPGRFNIDKDYFTLLDAIALAGDLTIYGKRDNILVQREVDGKKMLYKVDITSGKDLYSSPVYFLQQNDIVYVEPNSMRARQATVNGNNVRSASFWMSMASLLTTIVVLFIK